MLSRMNLRMLKRLRNASLFVVGPLMLAGMVVVPMDAKADRGGGQADDTRPGLTELSQLHRLPRLKPSVKVASISSYDRTGGNDDGFSGKYSFVRKEDGGLVIADLKGPGYIYRIWTPTPTDEPLEFYFDGETTPRIKLKFRELFDGSQPPFVTPLAGFGSGGFYSYLPLPYKKSCKVFLRASRMQFYQINYATYPADTPVETFSPSALEYGSASGSNLENARRVLHGTGTDMSTSVVPGGTPLKTTHVERMLAPGKTVRLFEMKRGGRIAGLRLRSARSFAGKDRAVLLKIYWDGASQPAVLSPVGDFFGYSWGDPAARSLLVGTTDDTAYVYFPMPFDRSARIEMVSEKSGGAPINVQADIITADLPRQKNEGRFYALWRRENPTIQGQPFTFVETQGHGHLVGVTLQAQGSVPGITPFFEGDDQATIDGELTIHGTGSEDFFNGGWYDVPGRWEARASYPLSGCLDYSRPQARSGAYRLFLSDAYVFHKSLKMAIEHAPTNNDFIADYVGVSYLYMENPPESPVTPWTLPAQSARAVHDPERLVFTPGWYLPLHSFSIERATLTKKNERIGNEEVRYLSMRAEGEDVFGQHSLSFLCAIPAAGRYRVFVETLSGPSQGKVQLFQNEHTAGNEVDFYAAKREKTKAVAMGELDLKEGMNQVFFKIIGKSEKAEGLGWDIVTLVLERIP